MLCFVKPVSFYSHFFDLLGTQTLKGYPMFQQAGSSSDKEMVEEVSERKHELKRRIPLKSRENHPLNKGPTRHIRALRDREQDRELRDRPDRNKELRERQERDKESRERPERDKESREKQDREKESRDASETDARSRQDEERSEKELKDRGEKDSRNKTDQNAINDEKEARYLNFVNAFHCKFG